MPENYKVPRNAIALSDPKDFQDIQVMCNTPGCAVTEEDGCYEMIQKGCEFTCPNCGAIVILARRVARG